MIALSTSHGNRYRLRHSRVGFCVGCCSRSLEHPVMHCLLDCIIYPPPPCRLARISITTPTTSSSVSPFRQLSSSLSISTNLRFELLFDLSSVQPSSCIRDLDLVAVALAFVVTAAHRAPIIWIYQRTRTRHLGPACVAPVASGRARCRPVWLPVSYTHLTLPTKSTV